MKINKILSYAAIAMAGMFFVGCQQSKAPETTISVPKGGTPCDMKDSASCDKKWDKKCDKKKWDMKKKCHMKKDCNTECSKAKDQCKNSDCKGKCGKSHVSPEVKAKMDAAKEAMHKKENASKNIK